MTHKHEKRLLQHLAAFMEKDDIFGRFSQGNLNTQHIWQFYAADGPWKAPKMKLIVASVVIVYI